MGKKLVIVESPAKARTINKILGKDYIVKASMGHVRDLPEKSLGVDLENNFAPNYKIIKGKQKTIKELQAAAKNVDAVYLAPDPDREGEAIAWHLKAALEKQVPADRFYRVSYNEITASAIRNAFDHPGEIDERRVNAQQARRILDRIVGYKVSPLLWSRIKRGSSAGRVQSVALRLVCEREKEITDFVKEKYWLVGVKLRKQVEPLDIFEARLAKIGGEKADIRTAELAEKIIRDLEKSSFRVVDIKDRETKKRARPPYITSSLQQAGSSKHGFAPSRTMKIAQKLYEGVNLGGGTVGLITYMRTDSFNIANVAREQALDYIRENYGDDYVPEKPNFFKSRGAAQEAHEAIRPTDPARTPESIKDLLSDEEYKLYNLIWKRFVASQMTPARIAQRTIEITAEVESDGAYLFRASASQILFPGYMKVTGAEKKKLKEGEEEDAASLPPLEKGEALECTESVNTAKETQPPARYTEASLIRALEENGVGRPSTYAAILSTLNHRKYVAREKRSILPTDLGEKVYTFLVENLDQLFNVQFTASMEKKLDDIEHGDVEWTEMLSEFYTSFEEWVQQAKGPSADRELVEKFLVLLQQVSQWAAPQKVGKREYSDEKFIQSVQKQFEGEEKAISQRQADALLKMALKYKDQLQTWSEFVEENELTEKLVAFAAANPPPRESTGKKLAALVGIQFAEPRQVGKRTFDDQAFSESLRQQSESGRRLSDRQIAALDRLLLKYADQLGGPEKVSADFELSEQEARQDDVSGPLLELMTSITHWQDPVTRGKRIWDDHEFYTSLKSQFAAKKSLSPKQIFALKKLVGRYNEQIPNFKEAAEQYKILLPKKKAAKAEEKTETAGE